MSRVEALRDRMRALFGQARATRTFVAVDVAGFGTLIEQVGEGMSLAVMQGVKEIVRHHARRFGGREIERRGDCFLLAFHAAGPALRFGVEIQRAMGAAALPGGSTVALRIAVHTGEALRERDRFFGHAVILTFLLLEQSGPREILISARVRPHVPHCWRHCLSTEHVFRPRGLRGELHFAGLEWRRMQRDPSGFLGDGIRPERGANGGLRRKFDRLIIAGGADGA